MGWSEKLSLTKKIRLGKKKPSETVKFFTHIKRPTQVRIDSGIKKRKEILLLGNSLRSDGSEKNGTVKLLEKNG